MVSAARHIEAMERVSGLVDVRERCVREVRERLKRYGFDENEVEDAIQTSLRVGLINEERYTRALIRGKSHIGWGRNKIVRKLEEDGIQESIIESCSDEFPSKSEEVDRALREIEKRSARSSNPRASYMRRLVGKGYSFDVAKEALSMYFATHET